MKSFIEFLREEEVPFTSGFGKLGTITGVALGLAGKANASDLTHGLHPLSVLDGGSLGTDDVLKNDEDKESDYDPARYLKPKQSSQNNSK